jgi:hypothetical protein
MICPVAAPLCRGAFLFAKLFMARNISQAGKKLKHRLHKCEDCILKYFQIQVAVFHDFFSDQQGSQSFSNQPALNGSFATLQNKSEIHSPSTRDVSLIY